MGFGGKVTGDQLRAGKAPEQRTAWQGHPLGLLDPRYFKAPSPWTQSDRPNTQANQIAAQHGYDHQAYTDARQRWAEQAASRTPFGEMQRPGQTFQAHPYASTGGYGAARSQRTQEHLAKLSEHAYDAPMAPVGTAPAPAPTAPTAPAGLQGMFGPEALAQLMALFGGGLPR